MPSCFADNVILGLLNFLKRPTHEFASEAYLWVCLRNCYWQFNINAQTELTFLLKCTDHVKYIDWLIDRLTRVRDFSSPSWVTWSESFWTNNIPHTSFSSCNLNCKSNGRCDLYLLENNWIPRYVFQLNCKVLISTQKNKKTAQQYKNHYL